MNFHQDQYDKAAAEMNMRSGAAMQQGGLGAERIQPRVDTICAITSDSMQQMAELCGLLSKIADGLTGPIPTAGAGMERQRDGSLRSTAIELRDYIQAAVASAYRIAEAL